MNTTRLIVVFLLLCSKSFSQRDSIQRIQLTPYFNLIYMEPGITLKYNFHNVFYAFSNLGYAFNGLTLRGQGGGGHGSYEFNKYRALVFRSGIGIAESTYGETGVMFQWSRYNLDQYCWAAGSNGMGEIYREVRDEKVLDYGVMLTVKPKIKIYKKLYVSCLLAGGFGIRKKYINVYSHGMHNSCDSDIDPPGTHKREEKVIPLINTMISIEWTPLFEKRF